MNIKLIFFCAVLSVLLAKQAEAQVVSTFLDFIFVTFFSFWQVVLNIVFSITNFVQLTPPDAVVTAPVGLAAAVGSSLSGSLTFVLNFVASLTTITTTIASSASSASSQAGAGAIQVTADAAQEAGAMTSYLFITLSAFFYGQPVNSSSPPYSDLGVSAPSSNSSSSAAQFILQAILYINTTAQTFEDLQLYVGVTGGPNVSSVQSLIAQWQLIYSYISASSSSSSSATLAASLNSTQLAQLVAALQGLEKFISDINAISITISQKAQAGFPMIKPCTKTAAECKASGQKSIKRASRVMKHRNSKARRKAKKQASNLRKRVRGRALGYFKGMRLGLYKQRYYSFYYYITDVVRSLYDYNNLMSLLVQSIEACLNATLNATETASSNASNATADLINATVTNIANKYTDFANQVLGNLTTFPNCTNFANDSLIALSELVGMAQNCSSSADAAQSTVYSNVTTDIVTLASVFNNFTAMNDACIRSYTGNFLQVYLKYFYWKIFGLTPGMSAFLTCQNQTYNALKAYLANATCAATNATTSANSTTTSNSSTAAVNANATAAVQQCLNTVQSTAQAALDYFNRQNTICQTPPTTTTSTTSTTTTSTSTTTTTTTSPTTTTTTTTTPAPTSSTTTPTTTTTTVATTTTGPSYYRTCEVLAPLMCTLIVFRWTCVGMDQCNTAYTCPAGSSELRFEPGVIFDQKERCCCT